MSGRLRIRRRSHRSVDIRTTLQKHRGGPRQGRAPHRRIGHRTLKAHTGTTARSAVGTVRLDDETSLARSTRHPERPAMRPAESHHGESAEDRQGAHQTSINLTGAVSHCGRAFATPRESVTAADVRPSSQSMDQKTRESSKTSPRWARCSSARSSRRDRCPRIATGDPP
jgi:hypothetical protein